MLKQLRRQGKVFIVGSHIDQVVIDKGENGTKFIQKQFKTKLKSSGIEDIDWYFMMCNDTDMRPTEVLKFCSDLRECCKRELKRLTTRIPAFAFDVSLTGAPEDLQATLRGGSPGERIDELEGPPSLS